MLEDSAAIAGIVVAAIGIGLAHVLEMPVLDGVASVAIGLILGGVAALLASETRRLLIGESARASVVEGVRTIALDDEGVTEVVRLLTMHVGPDDVLVNLDMRFRTDLDAVGLSDVVRRLEERIKGEIPSVRYLFIEVASFSRTPESDRAHRSFPSE